MANEISLSARFKFVDSNNKAYVDETFALTNFDQSAQGGPTPGYVTIGTSEETEAFSELSTEGWLYMRNLDATNYVQWGFATGVYGGRIKAGEFAIFRMEPTLTMYLKADTAAVKMLIYGMES